MPWLKILLRYVGVVWLLLFVTIRWWVGLPDVLPPFMAYVHCCAVVMVEVYLAALLLFMLAFNLFHHVALVLTMIYSLAPRTFREFICFVIFVNFFEGALVNCS